MTSCQFFFNDSQYVVLIVELKRWRVMCNKRSNTLLQPVSILTSASILSTCNFFIYFFLSKSQSMTVFPGMKNETKTNRVRMMNCTDANNNTRENKDWQEQSNQSALICHVNS